MINCLEVYNVFILKIVIEMIDVFNLVCDNLNFGVIILIGEGEKVFCFGGD